VAGLREAIESGATGCVAIVVNVVNDRFFAQPIGDPFSNAIFEDVIARAEPIGPLTR